MAVPQMRRACHGDEARAALCAVVAEGRGCRGGELLRQALRLLICAQLVLAAGCADTSAWLQYRSQSALTDYRRTQRERTVQRRTTDRLLAAQRECLAAGGTGDACQRHLSLYRTCLDAGGSDGTCRGRP